MPFSVPPGTKVLRADTVEKAVRTLEACPDEGVVVLDAKVLAEAAKAFLRRNRVEDRGGTGEVVPVFTPEHLNVLFGDLTFSQQTFLLSLLRDPGAFVSREELFRAIRGGTGRDRASHRSHALNQIACQLRKKLGPRGAGQCIETVHGTGFRWNRRKEPPSLSAAFLKVAGLALLSVFAVVAGVLHVAPRKTGGAGPPSGADGGALVSNGARSGAPAAASPASDEPVRAMRDRPAPEAFCQPFSSVRHAKDHSPWRALDGSEDTWFESAAPARTGDWFSFRFPAPLGRAAGPDRGRRIEILLGRPDSAGPPPLPRCRVECSPDPFGAPDSWIPAGGIDPATGRCALDLENLPIASLAAVRVLVTADSPLPLSVREVRIAAPETE